MLRIHQSARSTGSASSRTWHWIFILPMILCLLPAAAGAAIDVSESNLHDGQGVYGVDADTTSTPYLNDQDITLWAWGETDPSLYADVGFYAYGLLSSVDLINNGTVAVNAIGGNVVSTLSADADVFGCGLRTYHDVNNSSNIAVAITGGTADADDGGADTWIRGYGLWASGGGNSGDIAVTISGGKADANGGVADAWIYGYGLYAYDDVSNSGNIGVIVAGGTAVADDGAADAEVVGFGLRTSDDVNNSGNIAVTVTGGTAVTDDGEADAEVSGYGLRTYEGVDNSGIITVTVIGGTAEANDAIADASAFGCGIYLDKEKKVHGWPSSSETLLSTEDVTITVSDRQLTNTGDIAVTVTGGTASIQGGTVSGSIADANAYAYGLYGDDANSVYNTGAIAVTATGGTATTDDVNAVANANAYADGIYAEGDVNNTGLITVIGTGGTAVSGGMSTTGSAVYSHAFADIYGIYTSAGDVNNAGSIEVTSAGVTAQIRDVNTISSFYEVAEASAVAGATAYGMYSSAGDINNTGSITVMSTGGTAETHDINTISTCYETAEASASASARAYGVYTHDGDVNNTGAITVTSSGGTAEIYNINTITSGLSVAEASASAGAAAYGIYANAGDVNNTGAVTVMSHGGTADIHDINNIVSSSAGNDYGYVIDVFPSKVSVSTNARAYGVYSWEGDIKNTDSIAVTSRGGAVQMSDINLSSGHLSAYVHAYAYGICAYVGGGDIENTGAIEVTSTGGTVAISEINEISSDALSGQAYALAAAYGIDAANGDVNNTGSITVTSTGGTVEISDVNASSWSSQTREASALAKAHGIFATGGDVSNTGSITVTAVGGTASIQGETVSGSAAEADAYAYGIYASGDVYNSGTITVTATGGTATADDASAEACAYGIYLSNDANVTNTGVIRTSGDEAYELYVASGTTTLVDTYTMTLDGDDPNVGSIYVADGATIALNDADLSVAGFVGETLWDTEYQIFDANGVVDGNFAEVSALNPNTSVTYYDQNSVDSSDDTVSLSYTPGASEAAASAAVSQHLVTRSIDVVNRHLTNTVLQSLFTGGTSGLLADAGPTGRSVGLANSDKSSTGGLFVEPYYSTMDHDANPMGYDADLWGFAAGYERQMDNTLVGLHVGYGQADVDYTGTGYSANSEDQDILTAGVNGLTRWHEWTLRYGLAGYYGSHDYTGRTGVSLDETEEGETDSYGLVGTLMAGHVFRRGTHVLLPEVGLRWLWGHRQRYTTEASDSAWDTTYSAMNDHDLYAEASLNWLCGFMRGDMHVTPAASIGVRHLLTDADSSVTQSLAGTAPVTVESQRDRTALTLAGSVTLTKLPHSLSLAYDGEYSPDTERHSLWLRYAWQF